MTDSSASVATKIADHGWEQGSILPPQLRKSAIAAPGMDQIADADHVVVTTHSCDLVHRDEAAEIVVDLYIARVVDAANPTFANVKHPRRLHVDTTLDGKAIVLEFTESRRAWLHRHLLADFPPAPQPQLPKRAVREIAQWIGERVSRAAFPDALNERLAAKKPVLERLLRRHAEVLAVFVSDRYDDERADGEKYKLSVVVVSHTSETNSKQFKKVRDEFSKQFRSALNDCPDIEVEQLLTLTPDQISLSDLASLTPFDFGVLHMSSVS